MRRSLLLLLLAAGGCKDAASTGTDAAVVDTTRCQSFATEHERLLNAPTDASIVRKQVALPPLPAGDVPRPVPVPADTPDAGL